jgi:hypothetical protein
MKQRWSIVWVLVAGCTSQPPGPTGPTIGSGSVNLDGAEVAMSSWMWPAIVSDDTDPDLPTIYFGWTVLLAPNEPGTPCSAVMFPSWSAELTLVSSTTGSTPDDAPLTTGTVAVAYQATTRPVASLQVERDDYTGLAHAGSVQLTSADDELIEGSFSATGMSTDLVPVAFSASGTFSATRCDPSN